MFLRPPGKYAACRTAAFLSFYLRRPVHGEIAGRQTVSINILVYGSRLTGRKRTAAGAKQNTLRLFLRIIADLARV